MDTSSDLKIQIGCGKNKKPGYVNCDLFPTEATDLVFDCQKPWPFPDNSAIWIDGAHFLEHLDKPMDFFTEAYRVLKPNGKMLLTLPYGPSTSGFSDITHVRYWTPLSFACVQPGYSEAVGNVQHQNPPYAFAIEYIMGRINPELRWMLRRPWRWLNGPFLIQHLWDGYQEMFVSFICLKTPEAIAQFRQMTNPGTVPFSPCIYKHQYEGVEHIEGQPYELMNFGLATFTTGLWTFGK